MQKFLLAYNPMKPDGLFIVHCLHPLAIIEVSKTECLKGKGSLRLEAGNETWFLFFRSCETEECPPRLSVLKRAMYWFKEHRLQAQPDLSGLSK